MTSTISIQRSYEATKMKISSATIFFPLTLTFSIPTDEVTTSYFNTPETSLLKLEKTNL